MVKYLCAECYRHICCLSAATVVVEDEVLCLALYVSDCILEVSVLNVSDDLSTCRLCAWPATSEVVLSTPLVESDSFPTSLVVSVNADSSLVLWELLNRLDRVVDSFPILLVEDSEEVVNNV